MDNIVVLFFVVLGASLCGQEAFAQVDTKEAPEYVIVADSQIVTKQRLREYGRKGLVKEMKKSVTQETRDRLAKQFGDRIGDREFIILVELGSVQGSQKSTEAKTKSDTSTTRKNESELRVGKDDIAEDFTVDMIDGSVVTLSDLRGNVVLLNFWATWCAPCLMEFAEMPETILEPFKDKDFTLLPISIGEEKETVQKKMEKMKKYGVHFNVGIDPDKEIWSQYATGAIPKNFVIDKRGVIRYISVGNSEGSVKALASEIERLLDK